MVSTAANIVLNGWLAFEVSIENFTSSEVMASPSWKTAPCTRLSVTLRPSSAISQLSARYGCGWKFSSNSSGDALSCVPGTAVA